MPENEPPHPEWAAIFKAPKMEILTYRVLGRRIGYFINDIHQEMRPPKFASLYQRRSRGKKGEADLR